MVVPVLALLCAASAVAQTPGGAAAAAPRYERISVSSAERGGAGASTHPSVSADARRVAFDSASALTGDANGVSDVFVRDRSSGTTVLASRSTSGAPGNGPSSLPSLSGDGRFVAFVSEASNLVAADTNARADVFIKDLATGAVRRASVEADGRDVEGQVVAAQLSGNGRVVAFATRDDDGVPSLHRKELVSGAHRLVYRGLVTETGFSISDDGRFLAHDGYARGEDYPPRGGLEPPTTDVFRYDHATGTTRNMFRAPPPQWRWEDGHTAPAISGDGRYVAFFTDFGGVVPAHDGEADGDVLVVDMTNGAVWSALGEGVGPLSFGGRLVLDRDGSTVAVTSLGDGPSYVVDRRTEFAFALPGSGDGVDLTPSGSSVAFVTERSLVTGDGNGRADVYLRSVPAAPCTITGTSGADVLRGTAGRDVICALQGDDTVRGLAGDDVFYGGAGLDTADYSTLGRSIRVSAASWSVTGDGADRAFGIERYIGTSHADLFAAGRWGLRADGLGGADRFTGPAWVLRGGPGDDVMAVPNVAHTGAVLGGAGVDRLEFTDFGWVDLSTGRGEANYQSVYSVAGVENLRGGPTDDMLTGSAGPNVIEGGGGQDQISGRGGNDRLFGNAGGDSLDGGSGVDVCDGGADADTAAGCETLLGVP